MKIFEKIIFKSTITKVPTKFKRYTAFTLAEVLITLGIIGVVASLTIPTLIQKQQEIATASILKKAYSNLSQAYTMAVQVNGTPDNWNLIGGDDPQGALNMLSILSPYLKITKNCGTASGCLAPGTYNGLNGNPEYDFDGQSSRAKIILADGSMVSINIEDKNCVTNRGNSLALQSICALLAIDANGFKRPNQDGVDFFQFYITKYGIIPFGTQQESDTYHSFANDCKNKSTAWGAGCTAWVIYNENMDYLHCSDLAWDGKHKCS